MYSSIVCGSLARSDDVMPDDAAAAHGAAAAIIALVLARVEEGTQAATTAVVWAMRMSGLPNCNDDGVEESKQEEEPVCPICFTAIEDDVKVHFPKQLVVANSLDQWCGHTACRPCWISHVRARVDERRLTIQCPAHVGCSWTVDAGRLRLLLVGPSGVESAAWKAHGGLTQIAEEEVARASRESTLLRRHTEQRAEDFSSRLAELEREGAAWMRELCKPCPRCSVLVSRSEGCDHMHCCCGERFCYRCGLSLYPSQSPQHAPSPTCECADDYGDNWSDVVQWAWEEDIERNSTLGNLEEMRASHKSRAEVRRHHACRVARRWPRESNDDTAPPTSLGFLARSRLTARLLDGSAASLGRLICAERLRTGRPKISPHTVENALRANGVRFLTQNGLREREARRMAEEKARRAARFTARVAAVRPRERRRDAVGTPSRRRAHAQCADAALEVEACSEHRRSAETPMKSGGAQKGPFKAPRSQKHRGSRRAEAVAEAAAWSHEAY